MTRGAAGEGPLAAPPFPRLAGFAEAGRLPPSLLFSGPPGAPTVEAAIRLAAMVNSADRRADSEATRELENRIRQTDLRAADGAADGAASPEAPGAAASKKPARGRRKATAGPAPVEYQPFPDVRILRPDERRRIRVDALKGAVAASRSRPFEGRRRFLIIVAAETMNPQAANALLKTLEEPHPWLGVILCASGEGGLLPTIVSRCQRWRFRGLTLPEAAARLRDEHDYPPEEAEAAAFAAGGDPDRARQLPRDRLLPLREDAARLAAVTVHGIRPAERSALTARLAPAGARSSGAADELPALLALLRAELRDLAALAAGARALSERPADEPGRTADPSGDRTGGRGDDRARTASLAPPGTFAEALLLVEEADRRLSTFYANRRMQLDGLLLAFNEIARPLVVARRRGGRI